TLAAVDGFVREVSLGEPIEHDLRAQPAYLQMRRQARGELDQLVVEEGHASLDAGPHAHPIALDQDIVHESGMHVAIEEAIERATAVARIDDLVQCPSQAAVPDLVSH